MRVDIRNPQAIVFANRLVFGVVYITTITYHRTILVGLMVVVHTFLRIPSFVAEWYGALHTIRRIQIYLIDGVIVSYETTFLPVVEGGFFLAFGCLTVTTLQLSVVFP